MVLNNKILFIKKVKNTFIHIQIFSIKTNIKKKLFYSFTDKNSYFREESNSLKMHKKAKYNSLFKKKFFLSCFSTYYSLSCLTKKRLNNFFSNKIDIRLTSNNVFCTYTDLNLKIVHSGSSGKYKIKTSKKQLKASAQSMLDIFFYKLKKNKIFDKPIINLTAPLRIRYILVRRLLKKESKKKRELLLKVKPTKCFNGCRASKRRRKKKLKFRIYK